MKTLFLYKVSTCELYSCHNQQLQTWTFRDVIVSNSIDKRTPTQIFSNTWISMPFKFHMPHLEVSISNKEYFSQYNQLVI